MTVAEFYAELAAETKRKRVRWYLENHCVRARVPSLVCPVTFLGFAMTKQRFPTRDFPDAARAIGLTRWTEIAQAADGVEGSHRTRLLKAVGLED